MVCQWAARGPQQLKEWMQQNRVGKILVAGRLVRKTEHYLLVATMAAIHKPCSLKRKGNFMITKRLLYFFLMATQSTHIQYCTNYKWVDSYVNNTNS